MTFFSKECNKFRSTNHIPQNCRTFLTNHQVICSTMRQEKYEEMEIHFPRLHTERRLKEKSQNSFLTSLFTTKRESVDRDNLFEESGYTMSRSKNTATHIQAGLLEQSQQASGKFFHFYFFMVNNLNINLISTSNELKLGQSTNARVKYSFLPSELCPKS